MRNVICSMGTSLDGFIAGPGGEIDWALPKIVFSSSFDEVEGNATLAGDGLADEVRRLKREDGKDIAVGGAGLAGARAKLGLIDEYRRYRVAG